MPELQQLQGLRVWGLPPDKRNSPKVPVPENHICTQTLAAIPLAKGPPKQILNPKPHAGFLDPVGREHLTRTPCKVGLQGNPSGTGEHGSHNKSRLLALLQGTAQLPLQRRSITTIVVSIFFPVIPPEPNIILYYPNIAPSPPPPTPCMQPLAHASHLVLPHLCGNSRA